MPKEFAFIRLGFWCCPLVLRDLKHKKRVLSLSWSTSWSRLQCFFCIISCMKAIWLLMMLKTDLSGDLFWRGVILSCHWTSRHKTMKKRERAISRSSHVTLFRHGLSTTLWCRWILNLLGLFSLRFAFKAS